jgi:muconolactone delta-isomerase
VNPTSDPAGDPPACSPAATVYLAIRLPDGTMPGGLADVQQRLADAARKITESGSHVRYLNGMYMPAQNRLLCVFAADSAEAVDATAALVRLPFERVKAMPDHWDPDPAPAEGREPGR